MIKPIKTSPIVFSIFLLGGVTLLVLSSVISLASNDLNKGLDFIAGYYLTQS